MPPEYKNIIAIIEDIYGNKHIDTNIQYRPESSLNVWWSYSFNSESYEPIDDCQKVTHWMAQPLTIE